jgi:hypothetical protein
MSATQQTSAPNWESLYRRMRNVAAGYSNFCEESGSTRKLEREFEQIDDDARAIALSALVETRAPSEVTDAQIIDLAADFKSTYQHGGTTFDEFDALGFAHSLLALVPKQGAAS